MFSSSASEKRVTRAALSACERDRVVIGTVASSSYAQSLLALAASAHHVGFRCVTVAPYSHFDELKDPRVRRLGDPRRALLPEPIWCSNLSARIVLPHLPHVTPAWKLYGWRRSHLYRAWMWHVVVSHDYSLLAVDLDWRFISNPLPSLFSTRQPGAAHKVATVVAVHDEVPRPPYLHRRLTRRQTFPRSVGLLSSTLASCS